MICHVDQNMSPLSFGSISNLKEYLLWEENFDVTFDHRHYSEKGKIKRIASTFEDYALTWWIILLSRRRCENHAIPSGKEIKFLMRKHSVPKYFDILQTWKQSSKSVEKYYEEMLLLLDKITIHKDGEAAWINSTKDLMRTLSRCLSIEKKFDLVGIWKKVCTLLSR